MLWYLTAGIVIGIMLLLKWWLGQPVYYKGLKRSDLEPFFSSFVDFFTDGSLLFIEEENQSPVFIQFAKYVEEGGQVNLHFGYPDAPWSRPYFERLQRVLQQNSFEFRITETGQEDVRRFLEIDWISGAKEATFLASTTLDVMGIGKEEGLRLHFEGGHDASLVRRYIGEAKRKKRSN